LELYRVKNKTAIDAVLRDDIFMMENIFNTGGIEQLAIERLIFSVNSVEMLKLFLRFGGDIYMLGPPNDPQPHTLLYELSLSLQSRKDDKFVKLIEFIKEGAYVDFEDEDGATAYWICAEYGQLGLCKKLIERGADPFVTPKAKKMTALRALASNDQFDVCRYTDKGFGLDIEATTRCLNTSLSLASMDGRIEVCKYLLENGARVGAGIHLLIGASQV
jgi:ankyrin repeat protein